MRGSILLALLAAPLGGQAIPTLPSVAGTLAFDGSATLGDFTGMTSMLAGRLDGAGSLAGLHGWVEASARSLHTGNAKRDRDMLKALEVDRYPTMRFELDAVAAGDTDGDSIPVTLRGRFTIHGVTRSQAVRGWTWLSPRRARFRGQAPMNVKDYNVGGLTKVLGLLRMDPDIVVRIDVTFGR
jgi:polyisoprenoid-binding protein YceI